MEAKIVSAIFHGWRTIPVTVTVTCEDGHGLIISGLITETIHRDISRIQFALQNCGMGSKGKKMRIDIEPAVFGKSDTLMLAIAAGILVATGKITQAACPENYIIIGGLGVTGNVHEIPIAGNIYKVAIETGRKGIILPYTSIVPADDEYSIPLYPVCHLNELVSFLRRGSPHGKIELPVALFDHLNFN